MVENTPLGREPRDPIDHELRCWPESFGTIRDGTKHAELRQDDRDFRVGDRLLLREWIREASPLALNTRSQWAAGDVAVILRPDDGLPVCLYRHPSGHEIAVRFDGSWWQEEPPPPADAALHADAALPSLDGATSWVAEAQGHERARRAFLSHINRDAGEYTGAWVAVRITHILHRGFGLPAGYALLSFGDVDDGSQQ